VTDIGVLLRGCLFNCQAELFRSIKARLAAIPDQRRDTTKNNYNEGLYDLFED
jgi:hypothetical protein